MSDVFLMHQNAEVAEMVVQEGHIETVKVVNPDLLPFALSGNGGWITPLIMESWERTRAIPSNRPDIDRLVQEIGVTLAEAKEREMAVSLTDCYWHKEAGLDLAWEDINFYQNAGSGDISQIILSGHAENTSVDFHSPDFTTGGYMGKTWIFTDGKPFLLKRGNLGEYAAGKNLQSANEVAAYHVSRLMDVRHVPYFRVQLTNTGENLCVCPSFIHSPDKDFISAGAVRSALLISGKNMYRELTGKDGIFHAEEEIQQMILFDHIIHNVDRHEDNFGFVRDAEDFNKIAPAPLFDSGSSFGSLGNDTETKPFCETREKQLSLIDLHCARVPEKQDIKDILQEIYEEFGISEKAFEHAAEDLDQSFQMLDAEVRRRGKIKEAQER